MKAFSFFVGIEVAETALEAFCAEVFVTPRGPEAHARIRLSSPAADQDRAQGWGVCEITAVLVDALDQPRGQPDKGRMGETLPVGLAAARQFNPKALLAGSVLLAIPALLAVPALLAQAGPARLPGGRKSLRRWVRGLLPGQQPRLPSPANGDDKRQ
jgi:hypothetical protein